MRNISSLDWRSYACMPVHKYAFSLSNVGKTIKKPEKSKKKMVDKEK